MKRYDFEYHFYIPEVLSAMARSRQIPWYDAKNDLLHWTDKIAQPQNGLMPGLYMDYDHRIAHMDHRGIDVAVLSSAPGAEELPLEVSLPLCRKINDSIYDHMKRYPGRFLGSATLPLHDIDAACDELKRCVTELGFSAWHAHALFLQEGLDEERFFPVFKTAEELNIYVYLHPRCSFYDRLTGFDFPLAGSGLGFTTDTQITVIKMMLRGLFERLPGLKVMIGHLAEGLPFYLERFESRLNAHPSEANKMEHPISYYFKNNILVSTSGNTSAAAFECVKKVCGIDKMFIGTDNPFEEPFLMLDFLEELPLTKTEREMLYYKNAERLLKIS